MSNYVLTDVMSILCRLISFLSIFVFLCISSVSYSQQDTSFFNRVFEKFPTYTTTGFVFPIGDHGSQGYYNAQKFGHDNHLGDDWNGVGGGNTDLGDTIYASAAGYVRFAGDTGLRGWGKVIRIVHKYNNKFYETVYAHCDSITVKENSMISIGRKIGTIGTANGDYPAHLHFEVRDDVMMRMGFGYGEDKTGYLDPTAFIKANAYKK